VRPSSDADSEVIATLFAAGLSRLACAICAGSLNVNHLVKYAHHKVAILLELRAPSTCGAAQADSRALVFEGPTSNRVGEIPYWLEYRKASQASRRKLICCCLNKAPPL